MKKAIIFGVTGQDGSHLADLLLEKNYKVIGVARRSSVDTTERIVHISGHPRFMLALGDITDVSSILQLLKEHDDVDEIYNLAAQSHVAVSFKQPGLTWDITGKGCLNILQSMVDLGLTQARFYQASSSEMFGKNYDMYYEDTDPFGNPLDDTIVAVKFQNEETKFLPQSPYAIAKCAAHYMVRLYREVYGIHASAGILFNHEGPRRGESFVTRKITKWVSEFIKYKQSIRQLHKLKIIETKFEELSERIVFQCGNTKEHLGSFQKLRLGNLEAFRDWGYAGDYVKAMWVMLQQDFPDDYVVCTGETHTIKEFLDVAFNHVNIKEWSDYVVQDPEFYRPAEVDYLRGDNAKAREKLGWTPETSFNELVTMMVEHDLQL